MDDADLIDRFTGCMLGLALGDSLGAPFEGSPGGMRPKLDSPESLVYTDDTEMALGIAESLIRCRKFDADDMASAFADNFNPYRGYAHGTIAVIGLIKQGIHWSLANKTIYPDGSFGNGAAMRVAPVGLFFHHNPKALKQAAAGSALITHAHPLAREGALLIAQAVAEILNDTPVQEILDKLAAKLTLAEYQDKLKQISRLLADKPSRQTVAATLGNSVLIHESAPTALYAFLRYGSDVIRTIEFCISLGGDTDTIAAMAGALSGARTGAENLPANLVQRLENHTVLKSRAADLYRVWKQQ